MKSQGVAMFCYDSNIKYSDICNFNIEQVRQHISANITIYTDQNTAKRLPHHVDIRITKLPDVNIRYFRTLSQQLPWYNLNRSSIFSEPPYDKTLLIDVDYIIYSNFLKHVLASEYDFLCYRRCKDISGTYAADKEQVGGSIIPFCWGTVLLISKSQICDKLGVLFENIKTHWKWYRNMYRIKVSTFRNDYALSIACSMLFGQRPSNHYIPGVMLCINDEASVALGRTGLTYSFAKEGKIYKHDIKGVDVHVLNKEMSYE